MTSFQLQQFRQKKADRGTDQKKDSKGSTSQGKSSKKSGKSEKHERKPDTSAVSDQAEAPPNVSAGGATSHVNVGEEVVDSAQTSANTKAHEYVSVHGSSSEPETPQPGNTTATSDNGAELRKDVVNSESDISISLSTEEENKKSINSGAVDSLTSDPTDSEKGVTHGDASINVDGIFTASGNLAEGEGVEVESVSGNVEYPHQPSSLHEFIPDVSLIQARGDQVTDVGCSLLLFMLSSSIIFFIALSLIGVKRSIACSLLMYNSILICFLGRGNAGRRWFTHGAVF